MGFQNRVPCIICTKPRKPTDIVDACGACNGTACVKCLNKWYSVTTIGNLVDKAHITCPFCKTVPITAIIEKYNKVVTPLIYELKIDEAFYYGWCKQCMQIKLYIKKTCIGNSPNFMGKFNCDDCKKSIVKNLIAKECPKCKVMIEKTGGCNHLNCSNCKIHFCFDCQFMSESSADVTIHMANFHGTYGEGQFVN
jgi:hypothetical protein